MYRSPEKRNGRFYVIDGQVVDDYERVKLILAASPRRNLTSRRFDDEDDAKAFASGSPLPEDRKRRRFYAVLDKLNKKGGNGQVETSWIIYDDWVCVLDKVLKGEDRYRRYRFQGFDSEHAAVSALREWVGIPDKVYEPLNADGTKALPPVETFHRQPSGKLNFEMYAKVSRSQHMTTY
jgi:hypothetical protein